MDFSTKVECAFPMVISSKSRRPARWRIPLYTVILNLNDDLVTETRFSLDGFTERYQNRSWMTHFYFESAYFQLSKLKPIKGWPSDHHQFEIAYTVLFTPHATYFVFTLSPHYKCRTIVARRLILENWEKRGESVRVVCDMNKTVGLG